MNKINSNLFFSMKFAYEQSKFWREKISESFNNKNFIKIFKKLKIIDKNTLLMDQEKKKMIVLKINSVRIHKTSGTTSKPLFIYLSKKDVESSIIVGSRAFTAAGLKNEDKVIHCLNFNMWSGGVTDFNCLEYSGATSIPYGVGNTEQLIKTIKDLKINAISATPSYMNVIHQQCKVLNIDPKDLGLKKGFFGGESLIADKANKKFIEKTFGLIAMDANYGLSEVMSIIAGETLEKKNVLKFHALDYLFIELFNKNKKIKIKKGSVGELVISTLKKECQPLLRYTTNDVIRVEDVKKNKEGEITEFYFNVIGRSDEMLIIKGINIFPSAIADQIYNQLGIKSIFKIKKPKNLITDKLTIFFNKNDVLKEYRYLNEDFFIKKIKSSIKSNLNISCEIFLIEKNLQDRANKQNFFYRF
jgi:phenylacetate-CoA ligase